ncbi:MAG: DUF6125 family protein [Thermodesulfobacteriota bacterium]
MKAVARKDLIVLLNKCWMTHDGMWFYSCLQEFGIEKANKLNKSAIKLLAPIEVKRMKNALAMEGEIDSFDQFKEFVQGAYELVIPDFMGAQMSFPRENVLRWTFKQNQCFAYKGMNSIGVIADYECGVIYRLACWFRSLGLAFDVVPPMDKCLMHYRGNCEGDFVFRF